MVDFVPGLIESQTAAHDLKAELILFVDHDAHGFALIEGDAARPFGIGEFAADQLPLDEQLAIHGDRAGILMYSRSGCGSSILSDFGRGGRFDFGLLICTGAVGKGKGGQVPGQANAGWK